jgi:hypothetical protein
MSFVDEHQFECTQDIKYVDLCPTVFIIDFLQIAASAQKLGVVLMANVVSKTDKIV